MTDVLWGKQYRGDGAGEQVLRQEVEPHLCEKMEMLKDFAHKLFEDNKNGVVAETIKLLHLYGDSDCIPENECEKVADTRLDGVEPTVVRAIAKELESSVNVKRIKIKGG